MPGLPGNPGAPGIPMGPCEKYVIHYGKLINAFKCLLYIVVLMGFIWVYGIFGKKSFTYHWTRFPSISRCSSFSLQKKKHRFSSKIIVQQYALLKNYLLIHTAQQKFQGYYYSFFFFTGYLLGFKY